MVSTILNIWGHPPLGPGRSPSFPRLWAGLAAARHIAGGALLDAICKVLSQCVPSSPPMAMFIDGPARRGPSSPTTVKFVDGPACVPALSSRPIRPRACSFTPAATPLLVVLHPHRKRPCSSAPQHGHRPVYAGAVGRRGSGGEAAKCHVWSLVWCLAIVVGLCRRRRDVK